MDKHKAGTETIFNSNRKSLFAKVKNQTHSKQIDSHGSMKNQLNDYDPTESPKITRGQGNNVSQGKDEGTINSQMHNHCTNFSGAIAQEEDDFEFEETTAEI